MKSFLSYFSFYPYIMVFGSVQDPFENNTLALNVYPV